MEPPGSPYQDTVVVPADHGGSSLACIRSLGRLGVDVVGVASDESAPALTSKYCDETRVAPSPDEDLDGYRDALLDLANRKRVRTVVPMYEPDIYVLSKHRDELRGRVATPWSDFDTVRRAQDRRRLFDIAADAGVQTPDTRLLTEWDRWDERSVVKPRYTMVVDDGAVTYPEVQVREPGAAPATDEVVDEMGHEPIVQEYVPGAEEHGFFALYDEGDPVATFQHRRVRSYTYAGGASVYREAIDDPALRRAGTAVLDALDWHGPAMVEFKRDDQGEYTLLEVNPRFWGSLPLAVTAGVDFPRCYYELATDRLDGLPPEYETGVGCHTLRGEASYLHSVLRYEYDHVDSPSTVSSLARVAKSLVEERNFDYLSMDDRRPFLQDVVNKTVGPGVLR